MAAARRAGVCAGITTIGCGVMPGCGIGFFCGAKAVCSAGVDCGAGGSMAFKFTLFVAATAKDPADFLAPTCAKSSCETMQSACSERSHIEVPSCLIGLFTVNVSL